MKVYTKLLQYINFSKKIFWLLISFIIYYINLTIYYIGMKRFSKYLLEYNAELINRALGLEIKVERKLFNDKRKIIHISNHTNPLDILIVQSKFKMPTITTADKHLLNLFPYIDKLIMNYGHIILDHKKMYSRIKSLIKINNTLKKEKEIFIYPNGSIITSIKKDFLKVLLIQLKEMTQL